MGSTQQDRALLIFGRRSWPGSAALDVHGGLDARPELLALVEDGDLEDPDVASDVLAAGQRLDQSRVQSAVG